MKRKNLTATVLKSQPLPAFGLSPNFDNIHVRLTRCEHGACSSRLSLCLLCAATHVIPATLETRLREADAHDYGPGNSKKPPKLTDYYHSELRLCPPEALYGAPERWAPPVNIWAVGHLVRRVVLVSTYLPSYVRIRLTPNTGQVFQFLTGHYVYTANANPDPNGPPLPPWRESLSLPLPLFPR